MHKKQGGGGGGGRGWGGGRGCQGEGGEGEGGFPGFVFQVTASIMESSTDRTTGLDHRGSSPPPPPTPTHELVPGGEAGWGVGGGGFVFLASACLMHYRSGS